MNRKPTYEDLEQKVRDLENSIQRYKNDRHITENSPSYHNASYLLTTLMNHTNDYILICDEKGTPQIFNAAYARLMKEALNLDMKPGLQPHNLLDDPEAVNYWDQLHKRALSGDRFHEEYTHEITKDDIRTFEVSFSPIIENDQINGFIELTMDITERKQNENSLRDSEEHLQSVFRAAPVGIGVRSDRVLKQVNKRICEMTGYSEEELIGQNARIFYPSDEDYEYVGCEKYKQISNHGTGTVETRWKHKDGFIIDVLLSFTPTDLGDISKGVTFTALDITERKKAEEENLKRQQFLESMFYHAPDAIVILDRENRVLKWNRGAVNMFGYTPQEAIGVEIDDLVALGKSHIEASRISRQVLSGKRLEAIETVRHRKDGTPLRVIASGSPIMIEGVIMGVVAVYTDITDRVRAEKALKESEEKYRSIFENAVEGFFQSTPEGRFISVNPSFASMFGYGSPEELVSSISDISEEYYVIPEDRSRYKRLLKKDGSVEHFEFEARCKDGSQIWVSDSTRAIYDPNGKIVRYEGNVNNITPRKKAEKALRESEAKYRSMMDAMMDTLYICSPDYRVEYMNQAMIKRIGRDATGEYCFKALHDLDEKCPFCVHDIIQQNVPFESDVFSEKDYRSYHVSHSPILHEDGSISKMTVYRDTTDFKKMETQLRQAQKMEAIGTLAGGVAHDFNNILFPMFGYLEMMLEDVPEGNPLRGYLAEVFSGAKRARDLVKQILTFSRQKDHDLKPLKVHPVINEALKLIKSSLPSTIEITQNLKSDCGLVFADPTQIHQIVMNLCTNAYHAMEEKGGKLTVSLKEVELTEEDLKDPAMFPGPHVYLTVADTGPGMEQIVIDRIFDPYFSTKEKGKGTGLGLAVVDGIIKSHGGHISVYSEPGKGTEFKVYLPVIKHQETIQRTEADLSIQKGDERILLVDDQELIVDMERQMLERLGYQVTVRISSTDALEAFRTQPDNFDVVITDLTMPNMTGDKLAEALIKIRADIPVILCTGFSEMMSKEKAAALGIKGFLMKPVVMKELSNTIRKVLDDK